MAVYDIDVPELNTVDALAEQREQRDQQVRARMSKAAYLEEIGLYVQDALQEIGHPLAELADTLFDAPIRSLWDQRAFLEMRDTRRLGAALMKLVAEASLASYEAADTDGF